ncbi:hypothetical protein [Aeromonas enteropelogenes]
MGQYLSINLNEKAENKLPPIKEDTNNTVYASDRCFGYGRNKKSIIDNQRHIPYAAQPSPGGDL